MLARTEPYEGEDPMEILKAVADENLDPPKRPVLPDYVPVKYGFFFFSFFLETRMERIFLDASVRLTEDTGSTL